MDRSETPRASQQQRSSPRQPTESSSSSSSRKAKNRSRSGSEELSQIVAQAQANARTSRYANGFAPLHDAAALSRPESATPTPYSVRNATADGGSVEQQQRITSPGLLGWVRSALMLGPSGRTLPTTAESQVHTATTSDPVKRNQTPLLPGILPSFHNVNRYGSRGEETRSTTLSERSASWSSIGKESIEAYDRRNRRASSMSTDSSASVYDVGSNDGLDEEDNSDAEDVYAPYAQRQHGPSLVRPTARREALGFGSVDDMINGSSSSVEGTAEHDATTGDKSATRSDSNALSISEAQDSSQYVVDQSDPSAVPDLVSSPDPSNKSREVSQSPLAGWVDAPTLNRTPKPRLGQNVGLSVQQEPQTPSQQSFVTESSVDNNVDFTTADEEMARRRSATLFENRSSSESVGGGTGSAYFGDGEDLNDRSGRPKSPEELIRNRRSRESVVLGSRGASARAGGGASERATRRVARESSGPEVRSDRIEETEESEAPQVARKTSLDEAGRAEATQQPAKRPTTSAGSTVATTSTSSGAKRGLFGRRRLGNASEPGRKSGAADAWDESDSTVASGEAKITSPDAKSFWRSAKKGAGSKQQPASVAIATDAGAAPASSNAKTSSECPSSACPTDSWAKRKQTRGALDAAMHPRKVKVRSRNKSSKERDFARLYLAQEIFLGSSDRAPGVSATPTASPKLEDDAESFGHQNVRSDVNEQNVESKSAAEGASTTNKRRATWAMRFSLDGQYLAVAGQDAVIRVYAVLATPEARQRALFETIEAAGCTPISAHNRSATDSTAVNLSAEDADGSTTKVCAELPHLLVFSQKPVREFRGHTSDILDLSWSKGGFLLSAGMDCTARVWHMSKPSSLVAFKHGDFVTCVIFHPRDDRFFLSGSLDGKLRLWNISTKRVQASQEIPGLITACAFTHSGKTACVGTFSGAALFYHTEDLVFVSSVAVRSATGKYQKGGRKITAIEPILPDSTAEGLSAKYVTDHDDESSKNERERVLITSNDSRVRAYDLSNNTIVARFKAKSYNNRSSQIKATLSDDNVYVVAGSEATSNSEGGQVHVWECSSILFERSTHSLLAKLASSSMNAVNSANQRTTGLLRSAKVGGAAGNNEKELEKVMQKSKNRSAVTSDSVVEYFTAHAGTVTCAIMAPLRTNTLLRHANDPILVRSEEKLNNSRLAGSVNLVEMLAGVPINIGRGLAYAIQTPLRMGANAVNQATRNASTTVNSTTKDSASPSSAAAAAENNEMVILNRKLNRIILTVDDNATVRVWRSDSLQTIS